MEDLRPNLTDINYKFKSNNYVNFDSEPLIRYSNTSSILKDINQNNMIVNQIPFKLTRLNKKYVLIEVERNIMLNKIILKKESIKIIKIETATSALKYTTLFNENDLLKPYKKIIRIGNIPCRFIRLTLLNETLSLDPKLIELFGWYEDTIYNLLGDSEYNLIYNNPYHFIYK